MHATCHAGKYHCQSLECPVVFLWKVSDVLGDLLLPLNLTLHSTIIIIILFRYLVLEKLCIAINIIEFIVKTLLCIHTKHDSIM